MAAALTLGAFVIPGPAQAGYGVQPDGQTIDVRQDSFGYITEPKTIPIIVYLDSLDTSPYVWVSTSPDRTSYGTPVAGSVGVCSGSALTGWTEPNKYVCNVSTILLRPGITYYWWLDFRRRDTDNPFEQDRVSGPFTFALRLATPPASEPQDDPYSEPSGEETSSSASREQASTLPAMSDWSGDQSIKNTRVGSMIYTTMKLVVNRPRMLAVACWTDRDFDSVVGEDSSHGDTVITGVWFPSQPRWLHLRGTTCTWVQRLIDTKAATAKGAYGLSNALHEAMHAYGIRNEAQANCYAAQLVPYGAINLGLPRARADYLRKLGLNVTRKTAPPGYWDSSLCRDGGRWDLVRTRTNLR